MDISRSSWFLLGVLTTAVVGLLLALYLSGAIPRP
jgi:hypothetical protein